MCSELGELEDRELVARFKATGEDCYFAALFERYQKRLFASRFRSLKNRALAEELVQEAFARALEQIDKFDEQDSTGNFYAWLCTICRNASTDEWREMQQRADYETTTKASGLLYKGVRSSGGVLNVAGREYTPQEIAAILRQVEEELLKLPPEKRMCWLLCHVYGYKYKEIAEKTGFSLERVETNIQAVARHLRSKFQ